MATFEKSHVDQISRPQVGDFLPMSAANRRLRMPRDGEYHSASRIRENLSHDEWHFALFAPDHDVRLGIAIQSAERPRSLSCQDEGDGRALAPFRSSIGGRGSS